MVIPWMAFVISSALLCLTSASKVSGVQHKVKCDTAEMAVEMILPDTVTDVYLEGMKEYGKDIGCQPMMEGNTASFRLSIAQFYRCGMTKVVDHTNGHRVYYHRIVVESESQEKESILVKCGWMPHHPERHRAKRQGDQLSPDFQEDEEYDITVIEGRAPEPILGIAVRQNGQLVGSDLNVQPGTLLQMEVYLDPNSTSTYGLRVSYMDVTDRRTKEETIILNGCSVDPYLFENFNTVDGDTLTARFRAFKFPETNFVLFRGTIDVCLDRCSGVECSNDQLAFGRKRRAASQTTGAAKLDRTDRVFEVSMTTLVKFDAETALQKDVLESSQAKGVDTVEQPIQAQQSQSLLNESEPSSKASSAPQQPSGHVEPQPEPIAESKVSPSLAAKTDSTFSLVLCFIAFVACLYNKY
ncbi:uncharacterized protein LOC130702890 [Daphnia carinata]|uniref:uncharacterized protein LOC130702890 n=1 Tax=Daphnia carinata TaxID=120202 RepID=UPI00257C0629|nr:uncharacterized protein LOC130702890 [Daphnia carinata]